MLHPTTHTDCRSDEITPHHSYKIVEETRDLTHLLTRIIESKWYLTRLFTWDCGIQVIYDASVHMRLYNSSDIWRACSHEIDRSKVSWHAYSQRLYTPRMRADTSDNTIIKDKVIYDASDNTIIKAKRYMTRLTTRYYHRMWLRHVWQHRLYTPRMRADTSDHTIIQTKVTLARLTTRL